MNFYSPVWPARHRHVPWMFNKNQTQGLMGNQECSETYNNKKHLSSAAELIRVVHWGGQSRLPVTSSPGCTHLRSQIWGGAQRWQSNLSLKPQNVEEENKTGSCVETLWNQEDRPSKHSSDYRLQFIQSLIKTRQLEEMTSIPVSKDRFTKHGMDLSSHICFLLP